MVKKSSKRLTVALSSAEYDNIKKKYVDSNRFRSVADFIRFTIRNFVEGEKDRDSLAVQGLAMRIGVGNGDTAIDNEKVQALKDLLGIE